MSETISKGTLIVCARHGSKVSIASDGSIVNSNGVLQSKANKITLLNRGAVLAGYNGATGPALKILDTIDKINTTNNCNLERTCRDVIQTETIGTDLILANRLKTFILTTENEFIEQDGDVSAIGNGHLIATAVARTLVDYIDAPILPAEVVRKSIEVTSTLDSRISNIINVITLSSNVLC